MVLVRHHLGDVLRRLRMRQGRTLREISSSARVSLGYLSEIERGQKEASSELLASICSALDVPLSDLLHEVGEELAAVEAVETAERRPRPVSVAAERIEGPRPARSGSLERHSLEARDDAIASAA